MSHSLPRSQNPALRIYNYSLKTYKMLNNFGYKSMNVGKNNYLC